MKRFLALLFCCLTLTACSPSVAQERQFLDLSVSFLGEVQLPKQEVEGTPVGGISGITFDRQTQKYYALSDDRSNLAPARFYTLSLDWPNPEQAPDAVIIEQVTTLKDANGAEFAPGSLDPEAIALSPRGSVFISSEGDVKHKIAPWIKEFDLATGQEHSTVRLPARFLPESPIREEDPPHGIQNNLAFESLTLNWTGLSAEDPFRLFTVPEAPLVQDRIPAESEENQGRLRLLHYVVNPVGDPVIVSENAYLLEPPPQLALSHGLSELLALDTEGYLLSLERSFSLSGITARLFQVVAGNATDTSRIAILGGPLSTVTPLKKQLLLDLTDLEIYLDNLEAMTLGPQLPDGSRLLVLVSDDNFDKQQVTQFLFFRLAGV
ncbi:MAG: esterase-like activity of phytase family protein [Spirulina sp. SIO3F2]|nr:esterase-like activity of phytase family protein [Spirulina sp. SIO3F2]